MNAKHRVRNAAFFVPDPWTNTSVTASPLLKRLAGAISQAVNDNASNKISLASLVALVAGLARYARVGNYGEFIALVFGSVRHPWKRALLLDLLLSEVFISETRSTNPNFATLFLNAGAHIQHHYMFSSATYRGDQKNPTWYAPEGADPVLEVYSLYDKILGYIAETFPEARLMIATGLRQVPYPKLKYYWRLKHHANFLRLIGVDFLTVTPRMSRDFLVACVDEEQARRADERLRSALTSSGDPLFEVDNRGTEIFAMLVYAGSIDPTTKFRVGNEPYLELHSHVAFVAIKNGEHDGTGYFLDSGAERVSGYVEFPLKQIPQRISDALGVGRLSALG
jgi:PAS domain-containing protein